jgi:ethanolamine utilization microcompartment shell protein EutL
MAKALGSGEAASAAMATVVASVVEVEGHGDAAAQSAEVEVVALVTGVK